MCSRSRSRSRLPSSSHHGAIDSLRNINLIYLIGRRRLLYLFLRQSSFVIRKTLRTAASVDFVDGVFCDFIFRSLPLPARLGFVCLPRCLVHSIAFAFCFFILVRSTTPLHFAITWMWLCGSILQFYAAETTNKRNKKWCAAVSLESINYPTRKLSSEWTLLNSLQALTLSDDGISNAAAPIPHKSWSEIETGDRKASTQNVKM